MGQVIQFLPVKVLPVLTEDRLREARRERDRQMLARVRQGLDPESITGEAWDQWLGDILNSIY